MRLLVGACSLAEVRYTALAYTPPSRRATERRNVYRGREPHASVLESEHQTESGHAQMTSAPERSSGSPPSNAAVTTDSWDHDRRYAVYMRNTLLGTSNLEFSIVPHVRIAGRFLPTTACAHITWVFQLFSRAGDDRRLLSRYVAERDKLRLELWDAAIRLDARVDLISTWSDDTHIVHLTSSDPRLWRPRLLPD